jgi:hypothetical protein
VIKHATAHAHSAMMPSRLSEAVRSFMTNRPSRQGFSLAGRQGGRWLQVRGISPHPVIKRIALLLPLWAGKLARTKVRHVTSGE